MAASGLEGVALRPQQLEGGVLESTQTSVECVFVSDRDAEQSFPSIPTAVDGVRFSEGLEHLAQVFDRGALLRGYTAGDLGHILHSRHQFHWHTCYTPPQTVAAPHIGSWIAKELGPRNEAIPAFIDIGQRFTLGEREELKAFHTAGFLGSEYGPFLIPDPQKGLESVKPPQGMSLSRFQSRNKLFKDLAFHGPIGRYGSEYQKDSLLRSLDSEPEEVQRQDQHRRQRESHRP